MNPGGRVALVAAMLVTALTTLPGASGGATGRSPLKVAHGPGPEASLGSWSTHGPPGGEIDAVAVAPSDPLTVYVVARGLRRSTDGGMNWKLVSSAIAGPPVVLVVDPMDPDILYAGNRRGVFKSTDGGMTWSPANRGLPRNRPFFPRHGVVSLAIDPEDPSTLYVGVIWEGEDCDGGEGVYKTTDGAATWSPANSGIDVQEIDALAIDPADPHILWAGSVGTNDCAEEGGEGVYVSTDGGGTWKPSDAGPPIYALTIDLSDPATVYAAAGSGLARTTDGGSKWIALPSPFGRSSVTALVVDPEDPRVVFVSTCCERGSGVYRSVDRGEQWIPADSGLVANDDVWTLAVEPRDPETLLAGAQTGLYRTTDRGSRWELSESLVATCINAVVESPTSPGTLYAGDYDSTFLSVDEGASWTRLSGPGSDALAVSAQTGSIAYTVTNGRVYRTTDWGDTWTMAGKVPSYYVPVLVINPRRSRVLYAIGDAPRAVFKTTDGGAHWVTARVGLPDLFVTALAIDPTHPRTLYVAIEGSGGSDASVFKSTNGGRTWKASGLPGRDVTSLAIAPSSPQTVFAGTTRHALFRSSDAGGTWTAAAEGLPRSSISAIAVDPLGSSTVYAGTGAGVFGSATGGESWSAMNDGLTGLFVTTLALDPITGTKLHAGTCGGGVFDATVG